MTRNLLFTTIFILSSLITNAQFKKNDILLGGQLSYSYNSSLYTQANAPTPPTNDSKNNNGNITVSFGKAINENTLIGINLSYQPSSSTNYPSFINVPLKYINNGYNVGIFYRKYKNLGKDFYFFGDISAGYYWSNQSGRDTIGEKLLWGSTWSVGINLSPGIAYRISKHFFMELIMPNLFYAGYYKYDLENQYGNATQIQSNKNDQLTISTSLTSNPLTSLGVGFRLIL